MTEASSAIARLRVAYAHASMDEDDQITRAIPALLECAEALETVRGCGVLPISVGRIVDAALQALAEGGGE